ncbi:MAG: vancomycin aglycone glucosyltransferase, partial [Mycobacterium sp.]|nr:vancomycin aglycone glucosyltransferase [Mycobacterium sp.]
MKFVLAAYGSRGDVEPCAVVGRELLRRGHDVSIAVPPNMVAFVESVGLDAMAYGPDSHAQLNTATDFFVGNMKNPYAALPEVVERVTKVWVDKGTALASLAEGADLLVTGMNEQRLAANIAEHQDIPLVALHFFPSRLQPSGQLNSRLVKMSEEPLRRALGLPEAPEPAPALMEIQAYDERCLPGQPDEWAEPGKPFVGALTLESPTDTDDAVLSWIDEGTAPVYFG